MATEAELLKQACLVGGQWIAADDGATIGVDNPATGEAIATAPP